MELELSLLMEEALKEAEEAFREDEVPVGAVLASSVGEIIARAHNRTISMSDPTAHAEILALRDACTRLGNYRLPGTCMVVTVEPCIMCMGAALHARIQRLVFGTPDPKAGAVVSLFRLASDNRLNHRIEVISGPREQECRRLMQDFFKARR
jgi:tRNA(adenine34) deaminase